ncbi:flagellar basal body P-ring formation protein FlgA [Massilia sp. PAMC28688]|uniref:flagellar basal body P-ring formation chaperone FlgA n=1 Tax=Massilia sp. PAMC28688 TaxID=2861283 RepID=UPI001C62BC79|nr:flagellar basal body P-ring formation chaperone FlgA [Massilia sp. PAMC28688]QYF92008.1 flagellar basal body P-ring formation protein FlgA [Massilia sp. PAMC28688]
MKLALALLLCLTTQPGFARQAAPAQDLSALRSIAEQHLQTQSAGLPGVVTVTVGAVDGRMRLAACPAPQAFQQPGARVMGKTTVGVRCTAPVAWTVYIQAQVSVMANYVAAAMPLAQGQPIEASQLVMAKGDLGALPAGVVTDMAQAIGRTSSMSLAAGAPLRSDMLKSKPVVQQGQSVRVVSGGAGFKVTAEAKAIGTASDGQVVQVRTPGGAIISGVARAGGLVEVAL